MGFLNSLKRLFGITGGEFQSGAGYVDRTRTTKTGRLRAKAGSIDYTDTFGADPAILQVESLTESAKKVYLYLSRIADKEGYCFPFYRTIAKRTKLSESTVSKAIKELEELGLITREQRISRRGVSSNIYRVKKVPKVLSQ